MGSKTYLCQGNRSSRYSTFQELRFIDDERKPFFLIKMCDKFEEAETRFRLNDSIAFIQWMPGKRKLLLLLFSVSVVRLCVRALIPSPSFRLPTSCFLYVLLSFIKPPLRGLLLEIVAKLNSLGGSSVSADMDYFCSILFFLILN